MFTGDCNLDNMTCAEVQHVVCIHTWYFLRGLVRKDTLTCLGITVCSGGTERLSLLCDISHPAAGRRLGLEPGHAARLLGRSLWPRAGHAPRAACRQCAVDCGIGPCSGSLRQAPTASAHFFNIMSLSDYQDTHLKCLGQSQSKLWVSC